MTDENIAMQLEMCIKYGETRAEADRQTALNKMIKFILGFILGGMAGVGTMCLVAINRGEEDE